MPGKQVKHIFAELFFMDKLSFNEETAFALNGKDLKDLSKRCKNLRDFTRLIASTEFFYSIPIISISKQFHVTEGAMAIRLEELGLVEY